MQFKQRGVKMYTLFLSNAGSILDLLTFDGVERVLNEP